MSAEENRAAANVAEIDDYVLADLLRAALARTPDGSWQVSEDKFWTRVTPGEYGFQEQGWKLHVSATPLSAPVVLARCAGILLASGCAFKFARDLKHVDALVDVHCPRGHSGKFITMYPVNDDMLRMVAGELHEATVDLRGPRILSDRQLVPGSLVHYRYGVAAGTLVLTNDGSFESMLIAPDGSAVRDNRLAWFSPPPWAELPFAGAPLFEPPFAGPVPGPVRLGDRFLVRRAITHANKGGVYVATDAEDGAEVIVKQAREHVGAGLDGRDCRDDLRHEARMLDAFAPLRIAPRKIALFEQQESLFLAEELVPGTRLTEWVTASARRYPPAARARAGAIGALASDLIDVLASAHSTGLVLRDFNPNNLMVMPDERVRLIDLECVVRPGTRVARRFTPGFSAPEQAEAPYLWPAPGQEADLFSLGATLFYLATCTPPLLPPDVPHRRELTGRLAELMSFMAADNSALAALAPLIAGLMDEIPERRWSLARAREFLDEPVPLDVPAARNSLTGHPGSASSDDLAGMVRDGVAHLLKTMTPERPRLWEAGEFGNTTDPCNIQYGAAGVAAVLARADPAGNDGRLRAGTAAVAAWIEERRDAVPRVLPGLYFGSSGTAWALHDVAAYLGDTDMASRATALAESVPLAGWGNPDVAHGLAGAGLAQLHLWQATGRDSLRQRALHCADAVLRSARVRGTETLWPIPAEFDSQMAGVAHYGFAHGVAGAGAFLLYCGAATGDENLIEAALSAGRTLSHAAVTDGGAARWPAAPGESVDKSLQHWCSGASGIGTFLIRLWHVTRERRFLDLADAAAVTVVTQRWQAGNSACHGLAGDGDFLLDMARLTGQEKYLDWASAIATALYAKRAYIDGLAVVAGEKPTEVIAAYNTGLAGVLSFFDRLLHRGPRPWLPDELLEL